MSTNYTDSLVYTNQPIPLSTIFIDQDGNVVSLSGKTVRYDYWLPTNSIPTPTGFVNGVIEDAAAGSASGIIPASANTTAGKKFRVQGVVIEGSDEYPEDTTNIPILERGK